MPYEDYTETVRAALTDEQAPTPRIDDFLVDLDHDANLEWRLAGGHINNLLGEAIDRMLRAEAVIAEIKRRIGEYPMPINIPTDTFWPREVRDLAGIRELLLRYETQDALEELLSALGGDGSEAATSAES